MPKSKGKLNIMHPWRKAGESGESYRATLIREIARGIAVTIIPNTVGIYIGTFRTIDGEKKKCK
jgi:hypothetical protein